MISVRGRFGEDGGVSLARVIVRADGCGALAKTNPRRLLQPALIDRLEAPLRASPRRADRTSGDRNEYRVGVRRAGDAQGDPAAALDRDFETNVMERAVRGDPIRRPDAAVHDCFDLHVAGAANPCVLGRPVRTAI